jgi:hypothetical protein
MRRGAPPCAASLCGIRCLVLAAVPNIVIADFVVILETGRDRAKQLIHHVVKHALEPTFVEEVSGDSINHASSGRGIGKQCRQQDLEQPIALEAVEVIG